MILTSITKVFFNFDVRFRPHAVQVISSNANFHLSEFILLLCETFLIACLSLKGLG